ncbi:DUF86 domain-containing protein [Paenibacillus urinalis]|uniref:DUF86 domain-containing protein n=1 Tax=Paenibacillus urinalis TaxID=521520 RepID=A0AAX3N6K7_9BACL|nr:MULTISPECIES: HepT-like ribonuclease domain-containing protein [Paenibacillus]WDH84307.1 DUF86 domain-containing protein [Paenibacillus urinalis]WDH95776.1 DUF86 domain-containing protein [Paenibacillus urinalis]WDI03990.1 DUF86 domain-containing protein [Paenibacillus urinalis]GAK38702.1 hypothetical protein TCA2_0428 [Paenibacillus sp. TCA20]
MYYVNTDQIELRLSAIPEITAGLRHAQDNWDGGIILGFVQERSLHLALEIVTDVGSYLIDGFILRDASSYEDIIEIVHEAGAFDEESYKLFMELVPLRKPLVQDYYAWDRTSLHKVTRTLPDVLDRFADQIRLYLEKELGPFQPSRN